MSQRQFDIVFLGATGYTGKLIAEYVVKNYGPSGKTFKYAFAGRDEAKLAAVRSQLSLIDSEAQKIQLITADTTNEQSILDMCRSTRIVVTTVGPYAKYGEVVVAKCCEAGTHCCDLTGEVHWIRLMIDKYHKEASEKKVKIVNCCGYDCIPADCGTLMLQERSNAAFGIPLERVDYRYQSGKGGVSGGTIASIFCITALPKTIWDEMEHPYYLCGNGTPATVKQIEQPNQNIVHYDKVFGMYTIPAVMEFIDSRLVRRSNFLLDKTAFEYHAAALFSRYWVAAKVSTMFMGLVKTLIRYSTVRYLLAKLLPKPGEGPSVEARKKGNFWIRLVGRTTDKSGQSHTIMATVGSDKGDPGYTETAKMMTETALCLLLTPEAKAPQIYGVVTPSVACGSLLAERLNAAGMTFKIDSVT